MIINWDMSNRTFRKAVHLKIWASVVLMVIGAATLGLTLMVLSENYQGVMDDRTRSFISGFYTGIGSGVLVASFITLIKHIILLKNEAKFKMAEIAYYDERNRFIISKTFSITAYVSLFTLLMGVVITGLMNPVVFKTLLVVLGVYGAILFTTYLVVKARH